MCEQFGLPPLPAWPVVPSRRRPCAADFVLILVTCSYHASHYAGVLSCTARRSPMPQDATVAEQVELGAGGGGANGSVRPVICDGTVGSHGRLARSHVAQLLRVVGQLAVGRCLYW